MSEDLTYIEQLDIKDQEHRHALELEEVRGRIAEAEAREQRKAQIGVQRWEAVQLIGVGLLVLALLFGIGFWIYSGTTGKPYHPDQEVQREKACIEQGGGFVPRDMLDGSADDHGLCVFPGKRAG